MSIGFLFYTFNFIYMARKNAIKAFWSLLDQIKDHFDLQQGEKERHLHILHNKEKEFCFVLEERKDLIGGIKGPSYKVYCIAYTRGETKEVEFGLYSPTEKIITLLS